MADPVSGFPSVSSSGLRRLLSPPSLPLAERTARAVLRSSGSSGVQGIWLAPALACSEPSGLPASPDSRRAPWFPASCGWLSRLSSNAPSSGLVPSTDFRPQSSVHPL